MSSAVAETNGHVDAVGVWAGIDNAAYHADRTAVSHSALECFRRSRRLYHGVYVTGSIPAPAPSPAMRLGSALHAALLEPDTASEVYCVEPVGADRRTKAGKEAWTAFEAEANGKIVLCRDQEAALLGMVASVRDNPFARVLLDTPGIVEQAVRWVDPLTGLKLKAKPDKRFDSGVMVDLKTAQDPTPEGWSRAAATYGYARQQAHYLDGRWHGLGQDAGEFYFVVVGTAAPHDCIVYELDEQDIEFGYRQNRKATADLRECLDMGDWSGEWSKAVQRARLPKWARVDQLPY